MAIKSPKKLLKRGCCLGCFVVVLLIAVPAVMLFAPGRTPVKLTEVQTKESQQHIEKLQKQISEIKRETKQKIKEKISTSYELRMSEQDINTFIGMDQQVRDIIQRNKLESVFVKIEDNQIKTYASRIVKGVMMHGTLIAAPFLTDQRGLGVRVESLQTGSLGLPQGLAKQLADEFSNHVLSRLFDPSLKLNGVRIDQDALVVTGDTK